jgi:hypothetical protein
LVNEITAGDGKIDKLFLQCSWLGNRKADAKIERQAGRQVNRQGDRKRSRQAVRELRQTCQHACMLAWFYVCLLNEKSNFHYCF